MKNWIVCAVISFAAIGVFAQKGTTRADTLRGSLNPERTWWNVLHYDISITPDIAAETIAGANTIRFAVREAGRVMQIDLQEPMHIDEIIFRGSATKHTRDGNLYHADLGTDLAIGDTVEVSITFSGKPRKAVNPPWDGGWIWSTDETGAPWISVACQGIGASVWLPCKDHQSDEPDLGARFTITVADPLVAVANGKLLGTEAAPSNSTAYTWEVVNPINSYNLIPYIGRYAHWEETYGGVADTFQLSYYVLEEHLDTAKVQFAQVPPMMRCFEDWFGRYPFAEDGYKLVEAPHLGMEHQSAIAYGNGFANGYRGRDLSGSGWGLKWDFIIIHESGHEWFGNSITAADIADNWIHEGFTAYSETIYTQCRYGDKAGDAYVTGTRQNVRNDRPIIGEYGVNQEGSGDMYYKGSNMLHTIRHAMDDEYRFKRMMRDLNQKYYHTQVSTDTVEAAMSAITGRDLSRIFDQYLRTTMIPRLEFRLKNRGYEYRWANVVPGFDLNIKLQSGEWLEPTEDWQHTDLGQGDRPEVDPNFYITVVEVF